jgi:hypothetical protein
LTSGPDCAILDGVQRSVSINIMLIPIPQGWLYDVLELRTRRVPIEDLFIVMPAPLNGLTGSYEEGQNKLTLDENKLWPEFHGGTIEVFFSRDCIKPGVYWRRKFNPPPVSTPKTPKSLIIH